MKNTKNFLNFELCSKHQAQQVSRKGEEFSDLSRGHHDPRVKVLNIKHSLRVCSVIIVQQCRIRSSCRNGLRSSYCHEDIFHSKSGAVCRH